MSMWTALGGWIGKKIGLTDGQFWSAFYGASTYSGRSVGPENALNVSAWYAGVRRTSETVGSLPCQLYRKKENGGREALTDHPLYKVIHDQPNADQTALEYWEGMTAWLCVQGNAVSERIESRVGLVGLGKPIMCTSIYRNTDGELRYRFSDRNKTEEFPAEKVFHLRGWGFGGDVGVSPITYARQSIASALDTEEAAGRNFANGIRPGGWLKWKGGTLDPKKRQDIREAIIEPMQGVQNTGNVGLLEGDFDFIAATMTAEDSQMLESRRFSVEDVCRWIGIPPILVGHSSEGQTMWGTGVEQIMSSWYVLSLRAFLERIEGRINLLLPSEERGKVYAEFNVEGLLRADSKTRAEVQVMQVDHGLMTRNEARRLENREDQKGGDLLTVQAQMVSLESLENPPEAQPVPAVPGQAPQPSNVRPLRPPARTGT